MNETARAASGDSNCLPHALGRAGEALAAKHFQALGYRLLEQNLRTEAGEVDLVCEASDGTWVFCEVKTRRARDREGPLEALLAVSKTRRLRLARAALCYMAEQGGVERACRFDVVAIGVDPSGAPRLELHLPDAFRCDGGV